MQLRKRDVQSGEGNGGLFLRLKDGDAVEGIFLGELYEFHQIWENGRSQIVPEEHPGAKSRFRGNFLLRGESKPKIFEFGVMVYNLLCDLQASKYVIEKTVVRLSRRGTGTDTEYSIMPVPPSEQATPAQIKSLEKVKLNDLAPVQPQPTQALKNYAPTGSDDDGGDLPF